MKFRLMITVAFIVTVIMTLSFGWSIYEDHKTNQNNFIVHGLLISQMQAKALARPLWDMNNDNTRMILESIKKDHDFSYAKIIDPKGKIVMAIGKKTPEIDDRVFSKPISFHFNGKEQNLGELQLGLSERIISLKTQEAIIFGLESYVLLLFGTLSVLYISLIYFVTDPMEKMTSFIRNLGRDDFKSKLPMSHYDEFGILASSFNMMMNEMDAIYREMNAKRIEQERVNVELDLARKEAVEANKAKSTFLANMSHELRTPLNAIVGYSEMLLEELTETGMEHCVTDLNKVTSAARHLAEIINDILDLSKIESGKVILDIQQFELPKAINDVKDIVCPGIEKGNNKFALEIDPSIKYIISDQMKIRQNLLNLIGNASKFTQNGNISLYIKKTVINDDEWLIFDVTDNGIGIAQEQINLIFDPFTQADASTTRKYGGTGLGLAITKKICNLLGGDISVKSIVGQGSTFTMKLPVNSEKYIYVAQGI